MRHPTAYYYFFTILMVFEFFPTLSFSDENKVQIETIPSSVTQEVASVLADEDIAPFSSQEQTKRLQSTLQRSNLLPDEPVKHANGIYGMKRIELEIFDYNPISFSLYSQHQLRVVKPGTRFLSQDQSHEVALRFLKRNFSWFLQLGDIPEVVVKMDREKAIFDFAWRRFSTEGGPESYITAQVRAIDGKIVGFTAVKLLSASERAAIELSPEQRASITKTKISWLQAREKALAIIRKWKSWDKVRITDINIGGPDFGPYYDVSAQATEKVTGLLYQARVSIDANSGNPIPLIGGGLEPLNSKIQKVDDRQPVWTKQGLLFTSHRTLAGYPDWLDSKAQIFLCNNKKVSALTCDLRERRLSLAQMLPTGSWSAFEQNGWAYAFDVTTGSYRVLGHPDRLAVTPTISPDGKWAIVSARGRTGNSDSDLFADNLGRSPELGLRGRLVLPGKDELQPVFSPDGKWLYFVSAKITGQAYMSSLQRMPASLAYTGEIRRFTPQQVETLVAPTTSGIGEVSLFPDGKKLLLTKYLDIKLLDVATRKMTVVKLPLLKDKELKGAVIRAIEDFCAGPSNDEVTFSGETTDAGKNVRRRIYSCRLDGSHLRAWTPAEDSPVPSHIFSQNKRTAYEVAQEIALREIK